MTLPLDPTKFPAWVHVVVQVFAFLWMLATAFSLVLRAIPEERYNALAKASPTFGHWARAARKFGTDIWPFVLEVGKGILAILRAGKPPTLLVLLMLGASSSLLVGCPRLPEPSGCQPSATRCHNGAPEVCSQTQRWSPAQRPCAEVGGVCCLANSPYGGQTHACVPQAACLPEVVVSDGGLGDGGAP
jgi:hypothetical protein